ncbi:MAG: hypothetical protein N2C12_15865 [Planctomycetales bacterium]
MVHRKRSNFGDLLKQVGNSNSALRNDGEIAAAAGNRRIQQMAATLATN